MKPEHRGYQAVSIQTIHLKSSVIMKKTLASHFLASLRLVLLSTPLLVIGCGGNSGAEGPDPGIIDYPIAYVKRPIPVDDNGDPLQADVRDPRFFGAGGDLYVRSRATTSASETNVTRAITGGTGDVRDVDVSFDGTKIIFSLRLEDPDPNDDVVPSWNIYEYDIPNNLLRRIITNDAIAEEGDDISPHYLPDGRIVFASTRQQHSQVLSLDEGPFNGISKPAFAYLDEARNDNAFVLHVMDDDGTNIQQITFNQSHDIDPLVLSSGEILYARWDNASGNNVGFSLYKVSPSGGDIQIVYGAHSHDTGTGGARIQFTRPREMPDGSVVVIARPDTGTFAGGDIWRIDINGHADFNRTVSGAQTGGGQQPLSTGIITTDGSPSIGGRYHSVYPLWDGTSRMLVSKGFCQVMINNQVEACTPTNVADPNAVELPPAYSIWMYDLSARTEKFVIPPEPGMMFTDVVAVQPRTRPIVDPGQTPDSALASENWGMLHIRSVYDMDGVFFDYGSGIPDLATMANGNTPADNRPARFLRLIKAVGLPDPNDNPALPDPARTAFGPRRNLGMREILGYALVEPDGSVLTKVPANVPFTIEILDAGGRRIGARHRNWLQIPPGETLECNGCHQHPTDGTPPLPHGRKGAGPASINPGNWSAASLNTNAFIFFLPGETMAQARYGRCGPGSTLACGVDPVASMFEPDFDVVYSDFWVRAGNTPNPDITYSYDDLVTMSLTPPISDSCRTGTGILPNQRHFCRIIINYEQHIDPIWSAPRTDSNGNDATCTLCHNARNAANQIQVPAGQLNLTDVNPADYPPQFMPNPDQVHPYRELLFGDLEMELDTNGNLVYTLVDSGQVDENNNPILVNVPVPPSMSVNGARASYFMEKMTGMELDAGRSLGADPNTVDHVGLLTDAELKLIAEWLDIGAQYYNNPFDPGVPTN